MAISKEEVQHVAHLARLKFSEEEIDLFTHQLGQILDYVQKLSELETKDVKPTTHALALVNAFREDEVLPSFDVKEILANAPQSEDNNFLVPKVVRT